MGLTTDLSTTSSSYSPPDTDDELPPGGLPDQAPPNLEAERQAQILADLPGEVADGALQFTLGSMEGAAVALPALAIESFLGAADSVRLSLWSVRQTVDEAQQFLHSGIVNAYRFGPAPAFDPKVNINPPSLWSGQLKAMEMGESSMLHAGRASTLEQGTRQMLGIDLAGDALDAAAQGDVRELGRINGTLLTGLALGRMTSAPKPPPFSFAVEPTAAVTPAPSGLRLVRSTGPVHTPLAEGELSFPGVRTKPKWDTFGEPPPDRWIAAVDNGMSGAGDAPIPPAPGTSPNATPQTAASASLRPTLDKTIQAEALMKQLGMTVEDLDIAIAEGDPRIVNTLYEDPLSRSPVALEIVAKMSAFEPLVDLSDPTHYPGRRLLGIDQALGYRPVDVRPETLQMRVDAIDSVLPSLREHRTATSEAGLGNAATCAADAITKLLEYRDLCVRFLAKLAR